MNDPSRRLFFALWPSDAVRDALHRWQVENLNLSGASRWQHSADLHLTLHFLGAVAAPRVAGLLQLPSSLDRKAFSLVLDDIGHWPRPQVLWAAPSSTPVALSVLHDTLGDALRRLGFAPDSRPYRPHVTLARHVRRAPEHRPLSPVAWPVTEMALVESRPAALPLYQPVARWSLG